MSSKVENNFESNLLNILDELSNYHRNKSELIEIYVAKRLEKSFKTYYATIERSLLYLQYREENNLLNKYKRTLWQKILLKT